MIHDRPTGDRLLALGDQAMDSEIDSLMATDLPGREARSVKEMGLQRTS